MDRFEELMAIEQWVEENPTLVVERILRSEHEAFLWHVTSIHMRPEDRQATEVIAQQLKDGGYRRDAAGTGQRRDAFERAGQRRRHLGAELVDHVPPVIALVRFVAGVALGGRGGAVEFGHVHVGVPVRE
jgi:hypothetical protein